MNVSAVCSKCRTTSTIENATTNGWNRDKLRCGDMIWFCPSCMETPSTEYHVCKSICYLSKILAKCAICNCVENQDEPITWVRNHQNYWYCFTCYLELIDRK